MELCSKLTRREKVFTRKQETGIKGSCCHKHLQTRVHFFFYPI